MQNRYVGDVGDFGKHGLLRFLNGITDADRPEPRINLGVVWYMMPDERHGSDRRLIRDDGRHTGYLTPTEENIRLYGDCDRELWDRLGHLVGHNARCVHCVEKTGLLPPDTAFFDAYLTYLPNMKPAAKAALRTHWFGEARRATRNADLICVDPDNGIAGKAQMHTPKGPKHAYMSDLQEFWNRGQSLLVYQHMGRDSSKAHGMVRAKADALRDELGAAPTALLFHRGTARAFYVITQDNDPGRAIRERVGRFAGGPWAEKGHFEWVPC